MDDFFVWSSLSARPELVSSEAGALGAVQAWTATVPIDLSQDVSAFAVDRIGGAVHAYRIGIVDDGTIG